MNLSELLRYYEKKTGALISLQACHPAFYSCASLKLAPEQYLHRSDFCRSAKLRDNNRRCAQNKALSIEIAGLGRPFCGSCPYGLWEYAAPFHKDGELAAIIYFGNFRTEKKFIADIPLITGEKRKAIREASLFILNFLRIEFDLLSGSPEFRIRKHPDDFYEEQCHNFIECHFSENIALSDFADLLKVNPNYIGPLIRRKTGFTFRHLLTLRRIEEAKIYLKFHKKLSITEISQLCGFQDSNYFSIVFHRFCSQSPSDFRNSKNQASSL